MRAKQKSSVSSVYSNESIAVSRTDRLRPSYLFRNLVVLVEHIVNVARALPVDLVDRPHSFRLALSFMPFGDLHMQCRT